MSVYAPVPTYVEHTRHSRALFLIIAGHAALIAAVMTAKIDLPGRFIPAITHVKLIPLPPEPHPNPPSQPTRQHATAVSQVQQVVPIPRPVEPQVDLYPFPVPSPDPGPVIGNAVISAEPVRVGPRFITPQSDVKPPYPARRLRDGAEAVLRLRLSIDDRGRVVAVDPVGTADPVFLADARKHLMAHWRYRPATEDGRAVATSTVITLRFELGD